VTEAGAGGAIVFAESAREEYEMDLKELTLEQLKDARPDLVAALSEGAEGGEAAAAAETPDPPAAESAAETPAPEEAAEDSAEDAAQDEASAEADSAAAETPIEAQESASPTDGETENPQLAEIRKLQESVATLTKADQERKLADSISENKTSTASKVAAQVNATTLPKIAKDQLIARFAEATVGEGFMYENDEALGAALKAEITGASELVSKLTGKPLPKVPAPSSDNAKTPVQIVEARLEDRMKAEGFMNFAEAGSATEAGSEDDAPAVTAVGVGESAQQAIERLSGSFTNREVH